MEVVSTCEGIERALEAERCAGKSVGMVPTMGALHQGHVSLIERMSSECQTGAVSIFVNPTQFGPNEDLDKYPRALESDLAKCAAAGAQFVFAPSADELYPAGFGTTVSVGKLAARWCGASRPGHFDGVATVVAKLFAICRPHKAFFGEKDYQQLTIVRRMANDLNLGVEVVGCPTVREPDGLAMSSRNAYLTPAEREAAPALHRAMIRMNGLLNEGGTDADRLIEAGRAEIAAADPPFALEYLAVVDPATLEVRAIAQSGDRILVAAKLGSTRLIDNMALAGMPTEAEIGEGEQIVGKRK